MSKYGHRPGDWFEAIVNKIGGEEAGEAFLRGEFQVVRIEPKWREVDGVIYFNVTSDGTTGEAWIERLEKKGFPPTDYAKQLLRSSSFKPTSGVITQVAVLKGELFVDNERYTKTIRANARKRKLGKPNAEVACLIREKFSDEELAEMGLWAIITMHDPIKDSDGDPRLLGSHRLGHGRHLNACYDAPSLRWFRGSGFVFVSAQVSAQS